MHATYNLFKSYEDPIKNNIKTDSDVSSYYFVIFKIMILKLILFFYIFAITEGESNSKEGLVKRCLSPISPRFYCDINVC